MPYLFGIAVKVRVVVNHALFGVVVDHLSAVESSCQACFTFLEWLSSMFYLFGMLVKYVLPVWSGYRSCWKSHPQPA